MLPQAGLQVVSCGKLMPLDKSMVPWEMSHVTPLDWKSALVGTVAVLGVRMTAIPESMVNTLVAVFLVSAAAVAVRVTSRMQVLVASAQLLPVIFLGSGTD